MCKLFSICAVSWVIWFCYTIISSPCNNDLKSPRDCTKKVTAMIQITDAITDSDLGGTPFTVVRRTYRKSGGEAVPEREDRYETFGTVHPAKLSDLQLLPEEYRNETVLHIHSPVSLSLGGPLDDLHFTAPDLVICRLCTYLVISVRSWMDFGFCRAFAVLRKEGDSP